jgi:ribosomal protein L37AE/L43A
MEEKKEQKKETKNKIRCPKCNSTFGYLRLKKKEWQCRNCGYIDSEVII